MKFPNVSDLSSALAAGALLVGCSGDPSIPDECDSAGTVDADAEILPTKADVEAHCADEVIQQDTRQSALTCVYGVSDSGDHLQTIKTDCEDPMLDVTLSYVFNEQDPLSVHNYCVSMAPDLYCIDE